MRRPLIGLLRVYKLFISPLLGNRCRFYPSCSDYAAEALKKKGLFKGILLAVWRVARCNPLSKGGFDHVK
ncbi:MAG: membrane protein insertion efficiency factor YidD [Denitrovibrio sp.]|nr:MAG: membrane protein insertion efficiency factor YidD [Denitrovibrio sp.]